MKALIDKAIRQQKIIKECESSSAGHRFKFIDRRIIENIGDDTEYKFYLCARCGLGEFR